MAIKTPVLNFANKFASASTRSECGKVRRVAWELAKRQRGDNFLDGKLITFLTGEETCFLYDLAYGKYWDRNTAKSMNPRYILQTGVFCGVSAIAMGLALKNANITNGRVICIDIFKPEKEKILAVKEGRWKFPFPPSTLSHYTWTESRETTLTLGLEEFVSIVMGNSLDVLPSLAPNHFSIAFIDSNHDFDHVLSELKLTAPLIRPGGYIVMDDYDSHRGVEKATHEWVNEVNTRPIRFYNVQFKTRINAVIQFTE